MAGGPVIDSVSSACKPEVLPASCCAPFIAHFAMSGRGMFLPCPASSAIHSAAGFLAQTRSTATQSRPFPSPRSRRRRHRRTGTDDGPAPLRPGANRRDPLRPPLRHQASSADVVRRRIGSLMYPKSCNYKIVSQKQPKTRVSSGFCGTIHRILARHPQSTDPPWLPNQTRYLQFEKISAVLFHRPARLILVGKKGSPRAGLFSFGGKINWRSKWLQMARRPATKVKQ